MEKFLKLMPKIELHCHLDGSVRPETMYELLVEAREELEVNNIREFKSLVMVKEECDSLKEYLKKFSYPLKVMQSSKNIERIAYELLEDLSKQNIKYTEIRFAPFLHMERGLTFDEVVESVLKAMERAQNDFNILANGILICMRHEPVENSIMVVEEGEKYLNKGIVAVDLAGNEDDFPPEIHKKAFQLAYEKGFNITIHGGETGIVENIPKSIELLHAKRIGHGVAAIKNNQVMELLSRSKVYLEMCPTSNLQTKSVDNIENYPIRRYLKEGIGVTVNTDNMTVSNTSLEKEYRILVEELNFSKTEIIDLVYNSIQATFLPESQKENFKSIFKEEFKKIDKISNKG